jgi:hypothetical protein
MIENFEQYTTTLTDEMKQVVIWLDDLFAGKTKFDKPSKQKPLKAEILVRAIKDIHKINSFSQASLRHIINHLRQTGSTPILSCQKGYYTSDCKGEILSNVRSLEQRAKGIQNAADGLKRFMK